MKFPPAPRGLRRETKKFWDQVVHEFVLEPSHLRLLEIGCRAWDRAAEAREALRKYGSVSFKDKLGGYRVRPEILIERNSSVLFAKMMRELRITDSPATDEQRIPRNEAVAARRPR